MRKNRGFLVHLNKAYQEGERAARLGRFETSNPYTKDEHRRLWLEGYYAQKRKDSK